MTLVGIGGVKITGISYSDKFKKDLKSLTPNLKDKAKEVIRQLL
jgi:hypothetical protein